LSSLILRWRTHQFVYTADIEKMFRQILVQPTDTVYQLIWWRPDVSEELSTYRLKTVTYGTTCAPFLANRVLLQLAEDEGHKFPLAAKILKENFFVDDVLFGADNLTIIEQMRQQLLDLLMEGGFHLRKWASNNPELLKYIPSEDHGLALEMNFSKDDKISVLGVKWCPYKDSFLYSCIETQLIPVTKRTFLSLLASIFDPLGYVAPFIITGKIIIQLLWLKKVDWDEKLPVELERKCVDFHQQLNDINSIELPRWIGVELSSTISLHGFADASNSAYAAVVYLLVAHDSQVSHVSLLCAKTKVAPLKLQSIPRLELCAAVLLAKTLTFVLDSLCLTDIPITCWSDSKNVLYWLDKSPHKLKTFVAN